MPVRVMVARFPYGGQEHPDTTDWLVGTVAKMKADKRIDADILRMREDDTPITLSRNKVCKIARQQKADLILMLDNDMSPDLKLPGSKPFWDSTLDFMLNHSGPCVVAAPYCGPPPHSNVYVFQWNNHVNEHADGDMRLEQFGREEAAIRTGFEEVAALPTGLILIDVRALDYLKHPLFYYEWADEEQSTKASTEDVTFTRDLSLAGCPVYVNWDAWAGHWKRWRADKPQPLTVEQVRLKMTEAALSGRHSGQKLMMVGEGTDAAVDQRRRQAIIEEIRSSPIKSGPLVSGD